MPTYMYMVESCEPLPDGAVLDAVASIIEADPSHPPSTDTVMAGAGVLHHARLGLRIVNLGVRLDEGALDVGLADEPFAHHAEPNEGFRPFSDLRDTGLLWLINRVVLHPRGWALALDFDFHGGSSATGGTVSGWKLIGNGAECWSMGDLPDDLIALGHRTEDDLFALVQALLAPQPDVEVNQATIDNDPSESS